MKYTWMLVIAALFGCATTQSPTPKQLKAVAAMPPLPPAPTAPVKKSVKLAMAAPITSVTITNMLRQDVIQVWISRGSNSRPSLALPPTVKALRSVEVAEAPGPLGVIHPVLPSPPEPAHWMQADWRNWQTVTHGDIQIQMAGSPPWAWQNWASIPAANWMPGPGIVLQIGWQITDEQGVPFKGSEYQRILITPP